MLRMRKEKRLTKTRKGGDIYGLCVEEKINFIGHAPTQLALVRDTVPLPIMEGLQ